MNELETDNVSEETSLDSADESIIKDAEAYVYFDITDEEAAMRQLQRYLEERICKPNWRAGEAEARRDAYSAYPWPSTIATKTTAAECAVWLDIASVPPVQMTPKQFVYGMQTMLLADMFEFHIPPTAYMSLFLFAESYRHVLGRRNLQLSNIAQYILMLDDGNAI